MAYRRGDVWVVDFGDPIGQTLDYRRPAVVLSVEALNQGPSGLAIVVPTTTVDHGLAEHVALDPADVALSYDLYAKCSEIRFVSSERMISRLAAVGPASLARVERAVRILLDL